MISVQYDREGVSVSVEGHARSGQEGHDLVCAAVTTLFYTLAENSNMLQRRYGGSGGYDLEKGSGGVWYNSVTNVDADAAREIFDAICVGFALLAEKYSQFIVFEEI